MHTIPVLAVVDTPHQADFIISRLQRAGIGFEKMTAIFPRRFMPTAVACWTHFRHRLNVSLGRKSVVAVGTVPAQCREADSRTGVAELIERCHFDRRTARQTEQALARGQIVICIHAEEPDETSVAWHIFEHYSASMIGMGLGDAARHSGILPESMLIPA